MYFSDEILNIPARIGSYRDAGYANKDATRLAYADLKVEAYKVLEEEEYATPIEVGLATTEPIFVEGTAEEVAEHKFRIASELNAITDACVRHQIATSDRNYKIIAAIQNHLLCKPNSNGTMPKLEAIHSESISPMQLTMHMEDTSSFSLKEMWNKLKDTFKKGFEKIRTWYLKAFDSCSRLGKKAAALKATLESKNGTINEKDIDLRGLKVLNLDGKVPDANTLTDIIGSMNVTTLNVLGKAANHYTQVVTDLKEALEAVIKDVPESNAQQGQNTTEFKTGSNNPIFTRLSKEINDIKNLLGGDNGLEEWSGAGSDERFKALAESGQAKFYKSKNPLPGNKMIVISIPNITTGEVTNDLLQVMKSTLGIAVEDIDPRKEISDEPVKFPTLNAAQISKICDWVMESCKVGLDYRQVFGNRDKVYKDLGNAMEGVVNKSTNLQGSAMTHVRNNVTAASTIFNKINNGEGRWFRYAMTVFAKAIDYAQASNSKIS